MTNQEISQGWVNQAKCILDEAKEMLPKQYWSLIVRRCQESVELALKGLLSYVGIEIPRIHDVGHLIKQHRNRFTTEIKKYIDRIQTVSRDLKKQRETSFYGDEELCLPPDQLYNEQDARTALTDAKFVVDLVSSQIKAE